MAAQGQQWSGSFQIGKETTPGTAVPATRIAYFNDDGALSRSQDPRPHRFLVARRDNILAYTNGPIQAAGSVSMPVSAAETLELLGMTVAATPSPTTPTGAVAGRQWVYKPSAATDSATIEWDDGARVWIGKGFRGDTLKISGAVKDANMLSVDLFGTDIVAGSLTGALSQRVPDFLEGWQTYVYADAFGSAPGGTLLPGLLRNWDLTLANHLSRVYTADNTLATNRIVTGALDANCNLTFDAAVTQALTEFNNWVAGTKRVIRLEFLGPAGQFETAINEIQTINTSGVPTGGSMILSVFGVPFTVNFNDTAAAVKASIETAMAAFGLGYTVTATGGPVTTAPVSLTFSGSSVAGRDIPQITLVTNSLTGGTTPTAVLATTTPGYRGGYRFIVDMPGAWTADDLTKTDDGIRTYEMALQAVYEPTSLAAMMAITVQNNRATAY